VPRGAEAARWHEEAEAEQREGLEAAARGDGGKQRREVSSWRREGADPLSHAVARAVSLSHTAAQVVALSHVARLRRAMAHGSGSGGAGGS
jgi:hypothetical protein